MSKKSDDINRTAKTAPRRALLSSKLLSITIQQAMDYELSRLDNAIEKVSHMVEKYHDHPHAYDYYSTMQEVLLALAWVIEEKKHD